MRKAKPMKTMPAPPLEVRIRHIRAEIEALRLKIRAEMEANRVKNAQR